MQFIILQFNVFQKKVAVSKKKANHIHMLEKWIECTNASIRPAP